MASPMSFSRVLVVSTSSVFRDVLRLILAPHAHEVSVADGRKAWRELMAAGPPVDLVVGEVEIGDADAFDLLDDVAGHPEPHPEVILVAGRADAEQEARARQAGAIGYLAKPIAFRDIAGVVRRRTGGMAGRELRRRPGGKAALLGLGEAPREAGTPAQVIWWARDISRSGAFLETEAPLPPGTRIELALELGDARCRVRAEVVRVQEPAWGRVGGVGVRFVEFGEAARELIEAWVADGGLDTY